MSADIIDDANDLAERELQYRIAAARRQVATPPALTGECANLCGELPAPGSRWCCSECRDEDQRRARIRQRQGLR